MTLAINDPALIGLYTTNGSVHASDERLHYILATATEQQLQQQQEIQQLRQQQQLHRFILQKIFLTKLLKIDENMIT